ncbi:SPW repeat protein [bacterium]|nr:SPW repeat protein [bacterium]
MAVKTLSVINGILGLWLIVSAFLKMGVSANLYNYLIVGILVTIFGFWGATAKS